MKTLNQLVSEQLINEVEGTNIDQYWLDNNKPVQTQSGVQVKIINIDYSHVPNIITGELNINNKKQIWKWYDTGECIESTDKFGNKSKSNQERDKLVKAI